MRQRPSSRNISSSLHWSERGQTMLEFAVTFLIVITLIFIMVEGFSMIHTYTVLADAANEGVRYYLVNSGNPTGAQNRAVQYAANTLHNISALSAVCTNIDPSSAPPGRVKCTVTYTYVPYLSNFLPSPPTMHAYAEGRTVN